MLSYPRYTDSNPRQINKTIFSVKDNDSFLPTSYSEKTNWVIEPVDYGLFSEPEIEAEYKKLRK